MTGDPGGMPACRHLDRDGVSIEYEIHGRGGCTPVLFTHGFSATRAVYAANLPAVSASRRCIVWDIRGHGGSDAPDDPSQYSIELTVADMLAILDAEDIDEAVLVGHSMGGYLSLEMQRRHPDRIAGLVLVSTGPGFRRADARQKWNEVCERAAVDLEARGFDALVGGSDDARASPHRSVEGLVRAARGIMTHQDAVVLEALPKVTAATLVIVGEHDRLFLAGSSYMAERMPRARLIVVPGAGHAPMITHPALFNAEVGTFLDAVDRSS